MRAFLIWCGGRLTARQAGLCCERAELRVIAPSRGPRARKLTNKLVSSSRIASAGSRRGRRGTHAHAGRSSSTETTWKQGMNTTSRAPQADDALLLALVLDGCRALFPAIL